MFRIYKGDIRIYYWLLTVILRADDYRYIHAFMMRNVEINGVKVTLLFIYIIHIVLWLETFWPETFWHILSLLETLWLGTFWPETFWLETFWHIVSLLETLWLETFWPETFWGGFLFEYSLIRQTNICKIMPVRGKRETCHH